MWRALYNFSCTRRTGCLAGVSWVGGPAGVLRVSYQTFAASEYLSSGSRRVPHQTTTPRWAGVWRVPHQTSPVRWRAGGWRVPSCRSRRPRPSRARYSLTTSAWPPLPPPPPPPPRGTSRPPTTAACPCSRRRLRRRGCGASPARRPFPCSRCRSCHHLNSSRPWLPSTIETGDNRAHAHQP